MSQLAEGEVPGHVRLGVPVRSTWTVAGGLRVHARAAAGGGDRPVLVLVPGLVVSSRQLVPLAERLAHHVDAYAVDLPGFGKSDHPPDAPDVPALARHLASWLEARALGRPAVLGVSFGCQVVTELAAREPDLVSSVILVSPTVPPHLRDWRRLLAAGQGVQAPPGVVPGMLLDYAAAGPGRAVAAFRAMLRDEPERRLSGVHRPSLVVRGTRDPIAGEAWAREVAGLLPRAQLAAVERCGHSVHLEAPDRLARLVTRFLQPAEEVAR